MENLDKNQIGTQKEDKTITKEKETLAEHIDIANHDIFNNFLSESLRVGSHLVGAKGSGKTRLGFVCASELMKLDNVRVIIWDGSDTWKYAFNQMPFFNVSEKDILATDRKHSDEIEKYELQNWYLVKLALDTQKRASENKI